MERKFETQRSHSERVNEVLQYINSHIGDELTISVLAEISNYSNFHFHRIMRAYLGESIGSYIIRVRMDAGATLLQYTQLEIVEIAYKVGYNSPSSFNKAFKKHFQISPSDLRKNGRVGLHHFCHINKNVIMENVSLKPRIKNIKDKKVAYTVAIGKYGDDNTKQAWQRIVAFAQKNKLFGFGTECIGISLDNPNVTDIEKCRYEACIICKKDIKAEGDIGMKVIEGGTYAIFKHKGTYETLINAYNYIFGEWLPNSQHELRELPSYEIYHNSPDDTKPEKLKTDIYIPLE
jgi:AraC family transcriptional regulator